MKPFAAVLLAIGSEATVVAQTVELEQMCPTDKAGRRAFNPGALIAAALDASQLSRRAIDADTNDIETALERVSVVLLNPCASGTMCADENDKVILAQTILFEAFSRSDLDVRRKRPAPSREEREKEPWLDVAPEPGAIGSIAELVDPGERFLTVTCKFAALSATTAVATTQTGDDATPARRPTPAVRITSKLEELTREPDQDLTTVDPATLSIANDSIAKQRTFAIDGILGLSIPIGRNDEQFIPFVQYQRISVRDRSTAPAITSRSPDKLGFGAVVRVRLAPHDPVDLAPIYVVDYEKHSRVLSLKANWVPGFLREIDGLPVMRSRPLAGDFLYYGITPRVLAQGSHVADAGTNSVLQRTSDYLRGGGEMTFDFWGAEELANFTASVSYKRLFRLSSGPSGVHLFKTSAQFWLDNSQHVSLGYIYEQGLDEDTVDRVKDWKLSLGVRF